MTGGSDRPNGDASGGASADAESVMTRLDAAASAPAARDARDARDAREEPAPTSTPSSARGKRKRGGIRVPDDAVPAPTPTPAPVRVRSMTPMTGSVPVNLDDVDSLMSAAVDNERAPIPGPVATNAADGPTFPAAFATLASGELSAVSASGAPGVLGDTLPGSTSLRRASAPPPPPSRISTPAPMNTPFSGSAVALPPTPPPPRISTPMPMATPFAPSFATDRSPSRPPPPRPSSPPPGFASAPPNASPIATSTAAANASRLHTPLPGQVAVAVFAAPVSITASSVPRFVDPPAIAPANERSVLEALELLEREDLAARATGADAALASAYAPSSEGPIITATYEAVDDLPIDVDSVPSRPGAEENLSADELVEVPPSVRPPAPAKPMPSAPSPPPRRARVTGEPTSVPPRGPALSSPPDGSLEASGSGAPTEPGTEPKRAKKKLWFEELFNDDFPRATPPTPKAYLEREVSFIEESLGCERNATILDLACGVGEHAVALAKRGFEVVGIDLSLAMLARAADEATAQKQRINFVQVDMRELTHEDAFDGIYCWGTSFGYFDDAKNAEVAVRLHKALRRGGRLLLDVANRDFVICRAPSMVWFEGAGCICMDEMAVNSINSRLQVKRTMMLDDGRQREIDYSIRLYSLHELGKLLHDSGFRISEVSGDTSTPGVHFGAESPRLLVLAEKR